MLDAEAKRLAVVLAGMDAALGRATVAYLSLHKPEKTALRLAKAAKIAEEIAVIAASGEVRRNGVSRRCSPVLLAQAIESMLDSRAKLRLPLSGHGYLLEVAFGLADAADAVVERKREADVRAGKHRTVVSEKSDKLAETLAWLRSQLAYGAITQEQHDAQAHAAREKFA
jgi:hypothetical protein